MIISQALAQTEATPAQEAPLIEGEAGHVETVGETVHGETGEGAFPPFDPDTFASQLLWLAITFGIFYYLMSRVVLPRISNILETRRGRIAQDLDQAGRLKDDADEAVAAYEQELASARKKASSIATTARDKAKAETDGERKSAEAALDAKLVEAETRIASIRDAALSDVGAIAEETAQAIVTELIGQTPPSSEVASAVRDVRG